MPSGRAERQVTHSSASGPDVCKRTVHECASDGPSRECRGWHTAEHPDCVVWVAAETQTETANQSSLFLLPARVRESERSGITLPDTRGWSTQSDKWEWGHTVPSGWEQPARGVARSEAVCPHSAPVTKTQSQTHAPQESVHVCLTCSTTNTTQAVHAPAQPHVTPHMVFIQLVQLVSTHSTHVNSCQLCSTHGTHGTHVTHVTRVTMFQFFITRVTRVTH